MKQLALGVRLRADALFESFWPGLNGEIVAALQTPSTVPLWLWGTPGSGKTHLLQAVCAAAGAAESGAQAAYNLGTTSSSVVTFDTSGLTDIYGGNVEGGT